MHHSNREDARHVKDIFTQIADRYDLMNRIMTGGQDIRWRKMLLDQVCLEPGDHLLDIGTGTGDIARLAVEKHDNAICVGSDFTVEMMKVGRHSASGRRVHWVESDALALPFPDGIFDAVTSGFLVRNVVDLPSSLCEQYRVLRPGGRFVCLDTTRPSSIWLRPLIDFHMHTIIPALGKLISGHWDAYAYLAGSTESFLTAEVLAQKLRDAGFQRVGFQHLMFRTVALHWGVK